VVLLVLGSLSNVVGYQLGKSIQNHPPNAPDIIGPEELKVGISYVFAFVTTDPDGDNVSYAVDWGDGIVTGWVGPYTSGQEIRFAHTWAEKGNVYIKAKVKDLPYEDESNWTIHPIRWSYQIKDTINNLMGLLYVRHPLLLKIIGELNYLRISIFVYLRDYSTEIYYHGSPPRITHPMVFLLAFILAMRVYLGIQFWLKISKTLNWGWSDIDVAPGW